MGRDRARLNRGTHDMSEPRAPIRRQDDASHAVAAGWRLAWCAAAAGVAAGVAYTLSPLSLWLAVGAIAIVAVGGRGLPDRERGWLTAVLALAILSRVAVVVALCLVSPHDDQASGLLFGDEAYALARSWRMRNVLLGVPALKFDYMRAFDDYGRSSYITLMTAVELIVGPAPYGLRLLNALIYIAAVLLLFRQARRAFGALPAWLGLLFLLFVPTLFAWSIALLKEPLYFLMTVLVLVGALQILRARASPARLGLLLLVIVALHGLEDLRPRFAALACLGLACGGVLEFISARPRRLAAAAVAITVAAVVALAAPNLRGRGLQALDAAAKTQAGHVFTVGHSYKLLDEGYYVDPRANPVFHLTLQEAVPFVTRAIGSFLVVPLPWTAASVTELAFMPEQVMWYVGLALLPIGLIRAHRLDPRLTMMLVGYVLPIAVAVALTTGNVGTLIRHRTLIMPFVVWVNAVGFCAVLQAAVQWAAGQPAGSEGSVRP